MISLCRLCDRIKETAIIHLNERLTKTAVNVSDESDYKESKKWDANTAWMLHHDLTWIFNKSLDFRARENLNLILGVYTITRLKE